MTIALETEPAPTLRARTAPCPRTVEPRRLGAAARVRRFAERSARASCVVLGRALTAAHGALLARFAAPRLDRAATRGPLRLCLGSGSAPLPSPEWINLDLDGVPDVRVDLRSGIPAPDASAAFIYSEHLIEHLDCGDGSHLMRECRRVLTDDGVLRIATPDLARLVSAYRGDWRAQDWVRWSEHDWIDSAARMLNVAFHSWGHRHLYDGDELERRLRAAGFGHVRRVAFGESKHPELAQLETRLDSRLVVEAWGHARADAGAATAARTDA